MIDRQHILDKLSRSQDELATIKTDISDPEQACINYGLSGDFCFVFKQNLEKERNQIEVTISTLQKELFIFDLLVGTWAINIQNQSVNLPGQLNITSLNTCGKIIGTLVLDNIPKTSINGSYNDSEREIKFTSSISEDFTQQFVGTVNFVAKLSTIQGEMTQLVSLDLVTDVPPPSKWFAQKQK